MGAGEGKVNCLADTPYDDASGKLGLMVTGLDIRGKLAASAVGSVRAEGLEPSEEAQELVAAMVAGKISSDDLLQQVLKLHAVKVAG